MEDGYRLIRRKRDWVPDRVWTFFAVTRLGIFTPFMQILTEKIDGA